MLKIACSLLFLSNLCLSQEKCGVILDGSTRQSIPYATIYIPATKQGMYATDKGTFCMPLDERKPDSLRISAIGYTSRTIDFQLITTLDTLLLWPTPIALQEVLVKADRQKLHAKCP